MNKNRVVTYSLLAHINNSDEGIKDLNDVFVPIVKRTISYLSQSGVNKGVLQDIKQNVDRTYGLDIPYPILRKIITKISHHFNKKDSREFEFFNDGAFIINKFVFADYDETILQQESEIDTLNNAYQQYLIANNLEVQEQPSIFEFLDQNRISLSSFFANKADVNLESELLAQANFINSMKSIPYIYKILMKVYLGSIITSYLEVDYGKTKNNKIEFLVDTNFIINLLDLSSPESTHTCRKIVEICKRLGYRISTLDFTIEETQALLHRKADDFSHTFLIKQINPESIYSACARLNFSKTDLQQLASNFVDKLQDEYGIYIVPNTTSLRNKAKLSKELEILKGRKNNPDGAFHDTTAIIYVQEKRKKKIKSFYDANCWFVTYAKQEKELLNKNDGFLSEMIKPQDLVNILWLSNPNVKSSEVTEVGLTRLVSSTISNSLPSQRVLQELDTNIKKYANGKIEPADCVRLANRIANKTLTNLEALNDVAQKSAEKFLQLINEEVEKAKEEQAKTFERTKALITKLNENYEEKLKEKEGTLKSRHEVEIENLKQFYETTQNEKTSKLELENKRSFLKEMELSYNSLERTKKSLDKNAKFLTNSKLASCITIFAIGLITLHQLIKKYTWDTIEPWTYLLHLALIFLGFLYFAITKKEWNPKTIWEHILQTSEKNNYSKFKFDTAYFNQLKSTIHTLKSEIGTLDAIDRKNSPEQSQDQSRYIVKNNKNEKNTIIENHF